MQLKLLGVPEAERCKSLAPAAKDIPFYLFFNRYECRVLNVFAKGSIQRMTQKNFVKAEC